MSNANDRSTPKDKADFSHWQLPDVTVVDTTVKENLFGRSAAVKEAVEVEQQVLPPTLVEIETIRAEAETEGFEQGQQQGYQEGLEKGRLSGLEQGHQEGFSQGEEQGYQHGLTQAQQQVQQFEALMQQLVAPLSLLDTEIEQSLVNLSMTLAKAVIGHELQVHPEHVLAALRQGIDALPLKEQGVNVRLHPEDVTLVEQLYGSAQLQKNRWEIESDPSLRRGECIISNDRSRVDMGLENRIKAVFENLVHSESHLEQQKLQQQQTLAKQASEAVSEVSASEVQPTPVVDAATLHDEKHASQGQQDADATTSTAE